MCGLSGLVRIQEGNISDIVSMNSVIRHRGPDDEGYLLLDKQGYLHKMGGNDTCKESLTADFKYAPESRISENGDKPYLLAFGHRRLSILDLSAAGHQPMSYLEGRFWIVFNGQIYNHNDIRAELQSKGYQFTTRTDTEVVLAAYAAWSEKCLEKFVGMWSLAIYDHKLNEVFLSRDRYGIKPLYYWFSPDESFYFASEIKQFTVCSGWTADMNRSRVCDYLIYSFTDHTDETMFSGVYQLPAGSYFRSGISDIRRDRNGRIRSVKWYKLIRNQFSGSFQEAAASFRSLFEQAVANI